MLLRSLGKADAKGSLCYIDIEVTDLIPKSGVRVMRANGRMIVELFDDLVPNVTRLFTDMVDLIADQHLIYECGNNEVGYRCVWNQFNQKLDEAAMSVRRSLDFQRALGGALRYYTAPHWMLSVGSPQKATVSWAASIESRF